MTIERTATPPETERGEHEEKIPFYHVVLLDDDDHSYDYVVEMLCRLFCKSSQDAYQHAVEVNDHGRSIVITCDLPTAEFGRDQIHAFGPDPRCAGCKGSMQAILEPAASRGATGFSP